MPDKSWKALERWVAEYLGGQRVWQELQDVSHPVYSIECKMRKQLPHWLQDAVQQSITNAPPKKLPIVVLHEKGQPRGKSLVVIRLDLFREWYG